MKKIIVTLAVLCLVLGLTLTAQAGQTYTIWGDLTSGLPAYGFGPNGAWSVGCDTNGTGNRLDPFAFTPFDTYGEVLYPGGPIGFSLAAAGSGQNALWHNVDTSVSLHTLGSPGTLQTDANKPVIVRWTAPYETDVLFAVGGWAPGNPARAIAYGVRKNNDASLADATTSGLAAYAPWTAVLNTQLHMLQGDYIDFYSATDALHTDGWSNMYTFYFNLTDSGPVPEPGSLLALGSGLVGFAGFALRRRR